MLLLRLNNITKPDAEGNRELQFELNGMPREIKIHDKHVAEASASSQKADKDVPGEVGATLSGSVVKLLVEKGASVKKGDPIVVTEAMKMETTITDRRHHQRNPCQSRPENRIRRSAHDY